MTSPPPSSNKQPGAEFSLKPMTPQLHQDDFHTEMTDYHPSLPGDLDEIAAGAGLVIDGENVRSKFTSAVTLEDFGKLVAMLTRSTAGDRAALPLFAVKVAARKWADLQSEGAQMQRIAFEGGPGGAGTIDSWGVVLWGAAASALSNTGMEWRVKGEAWRPFDLKKCLAALGYEGRFVPAAPKGEEGGDTLRAAAQHAIEQWDEANSTRCEAIDRLERGLAAPDPLAALQLAQQALAQVGAIKQDGSRELHHEAARAVESILAGYERKRSEL